MNDCNSTLRRLAIGDEHFVDSMICCERANLAASHLDEKTHALVQIGTLIALDLGPQSYVAAVEAARMASATVEEIAGTLVAALRVVGAPRVSSAAPKLGLALGYDFDADVEVML